MRGEEIPRGGESQLTAEARRTRRKRGDDKALCPPLSPRFNYGGPVGLLHRRCMGFGAPSNSTISFLLTLRRSPRLLVSAVSWMSRPGARSPRERVG
jgi:hypothetical protein